MSQGSRVLIAALVIDSVGNWLFVPLAIGGWVRAPRRVVTTESGGYRDLVRDKAFLALIAVNTVVAGTSVMPALGLPLFVVDGLRGPGWFAPVVLVANTVVLSLLGTVAVARIARYRRTRVLAPAAGRGRYLAVFQYSFLFAGMLAPTFFTGLFAVGPVAAVARAGRAEPRGHGGRACAGTRCAAVGSAPQPDDGH